MGLQDLQEFIESNCPKAAINVDLDKVAWRKRGGGKNRVPTGQIIPLFVVLDAESCLHRLYGGSFTDWVCGGQWNQTYQFVEALSNTAHRLNIKLAVFFNGSLEKERMQSWSQDQMICKGNVRNILGHIQRKGVPPPKAWFTAPVGLEQCLRLALQDCGIPVQQSIKDHHREVMSYCRGNVFHGIIGHSADYIVFDPPRYFSSHNLKLSRDGRVITTTQFLLDEVAKHLEISQSSLPLMATLLGNHILTEEDVSTFQWRLLEPDQDEFKISRVHLPPGGTIIPAIAKYVRELVDPEDFDEIAKFVFKSARGDPAELKQRLKDSVTYFRSASRNGGRSVMHQRAQKKAAQKEVKEDDTSGDKDENDKEVKDKSSDVKSDVKEDESSGDDTSLTSEEETKDSDSELAEGVKNIKLEDKSSSSNGIPPLMQTTIRHADVSTPLIPNVGADVMRIAHHRHTMGLLHPSILQILLHGEIQIPISIEDDHQLPPVPGIYQQMRQHIYGILFSVGHVGSKRRILIKEWWASKGKLLFTPEIAEAVPFKDWHVPPLQQLWLGREPEDKNRRMRAFLSCVRCDTPSMLNQNFVPRHALFMCCVLRYLMQFPTPLLRRYEVDAFLATAVSPLLHNPYMIQDIETPHLTQRGLLIASLFMRGVETAMLANDACGEPVPTMVAAPWHYFDGKLFQIKLAIATRDGSNLVQLCEGRVDQVAKVERMRQAIMEGCSFNVAKTPFPIPPPDMSSGLAFMGGFSNLSQPKPYYGSQWDRPYNQPPTSFAQLKVAGYTVGNWAGGDYGGHGYQQRGQKPKGYGGMWFGGGGDASNTKNFY